jgi:transcriptional regulator with XRE-family HTH domain
VFPALLRYWRTRRGLSQLELALEADVSARHVSFLESARSRPSEEMVLRLLTVLQVPLREQNTALVAAGFGARFPEETGRGMDPAVEAALEQMMLQHDPFPLAVLAVDGTILRQNAGAARVFGALLGARRDDETPPANMYELVFDSRGLRPFIANWESFGRNLVARIHREQLTRGDARLAAVLERIFAQPGVSEDWRQPDFSAALPPSLHLELAKGDLRLRFLVAVTTFATAQQVTLDELRIESCFPVDASTRETCQRLASGG